MEDGRATGGNFLVRSAPYFIARGYNVAIFGRPSDMELGWTERTGAAHMTDIAKVLEFMKRQSDLPVWVVGTSRGTVSATAMAVHVKDPAIAGLVLTSSIVRRSTPGAVPTQNLQAIELPVLVYHHARDGCKHCQASDTPAILQGLTRAPVKKLMVVDGGPTRWETSARRSTGMGSSAWSKKRLDKLPRGFRRPNLEPYTAGRTRVGCSNGIFRSTSTAHSRRRSAGLFSARPQLTGSRRFPDFL